jgi:hypothetical protein
MELLESPMTNPLRDRYGLSTDVPRYPSFPQTPGLCTARAHSEQYSKCHEPLPGKRANVLERRVVHDLHSVFIIHISLCLPYSQFPFYHPISLSLHRQHHPFVEFPPITQSDLEWIKTKVDRVGFSTFQRCSRPFQQRPVVGHTLKDIVERGRLRWSMTGRR